MMTALCPAGLCSTIKENKFLACPQYTPFLSSSYLFAELLRSIFLSYHFP